MEFDALCEAHKHKRAVAVDIQMRWVFKVATYGERKIGKCRRFLRTNLFHLEQLVRRIISAPEAISILIKLLFFFWRETATDVVSVPLRVK